jgi:hypothetical protein
MSRLSLKKGLLLLISPALLPPALILLVLLLTNPEGFKFFPKIGTLAGLGFLAVLPFLLSNAIFLVRYLRSNSQNNIGNSTRLLKAVLSSWIAGMILSFINFGFFAYAEYSPYTGGGAAMALVPVILFGIPITIIMSFVAGIVASKR